MEVVSLYSCRLGTFSQVNASMAERSIVPRECAMTERTWVVGAFSHVNASLAERSIVPRECAMTERT